MGFGWTKNCLFVCLFVFEGLSIGMEFCFLLYNCGDALVSLDSFISLGKTFWFMTYMAESHLCFVTNFYFQYAFLSCCGLHQTAAWKWAAELCSLYTSIPPALAEGWFYRSSDTEHNCLLLESLPILTVDKDFFLHWFLHKARWQTSFMQTVERPWLISN